MKERYCKYCGKPIYVSVLRGFCSTECRDNYRREYKKEKERERRNAVKTTDLERGQYEGYNSIKTQDVDNRNGISKPLLETKKSSLDDDLTKEELAIAKKCCNWEFKQKAGYCVSLSVPYEAFETSCKDCYYFDLFRRDYETNRRAVNR